MKKISCKLRSLVNILTFLVKENEKKNRFIIESFSFPILLKNSVQVTKLDEECLPIKN